MMKTFLLSVNVIAATLSLAACESTREQFDFSKKAPDEFAVVKRAPLEMPPDFTTIRVPKPGAPRPQEKSTDVMARQTILGEESVQPAAGEAVISQGEALLLQRTGAANASSAIRDAVDKETFEIINAERPGIDKLKTMVGMEPSEPAPELVDPIAEANRIKQNKAGGKPLSTGKTPKIEN